MRVFHPKENGTNIRLVADYIGTFWLVLGGCGSAVLAGAACRWAGKPAARLQTR